MRFTQIDVRLTVRADASVTELLDGLVQADQLHVERATLLTQDGYGRSLPSGYTAQREG